MSLIPLTTPATVGQISFDVYENLEAIVTMASGLSWEDSFALKGKVNLGVSWGIPKISDVQQLSEKTGSAISEDKVVLGINSGKGLVEVSHCCGI